MADKDEVIKIHDNVKDGTDRLPDYYDYLVSLPEVIAVGLFMDKKMVCFIFSVTIVQLNMSHVMRQPALCICENKDADQLRGNREADQRLDFRYSDSTIPQLPKSEFSSL